MGRITVFSLVDCPHCTRAKAALTTRGVPYTEISLSGHPSKRTDMLSLSDCLTVPQFFFNEEHVGGADDIVAVMAKWDADEKGRSPKQIYYEEIGSKPDPNDARLAVPTEPPVKEPVAPPRPEKDSAVKLNGKYVGTQGEIKVKSDSVLNITAKLMGAIPRKNLNYILTTYMDCFRGSDGVTALKNVFNLSTREEALTFGKYLQKEHSIIHHVCDEHEFEDTPSLFFRLHPYHTPDVLNTFRVWSERVDSENPLGVVKRCKKLFSILESAHTNEEGEFNYRAAKFDPLFLEFEEAVCELQGLNLAKMDDSTKLAFCINVYNMMIKHAFVKVGIPSSTMARGAFFNGVKYDIGGHLFSFSELENGIIRSNSRAPYSLSKPFGRADPRIHLILPELDPRIHFALNCGAKSCPPIKIFSDQALNEELRIVAQAFCEQQTSVVVDEENMELQLSMILYWYRPDFVGSSSDPLNMAEKVVSYLKGEKKAKLERMIEEHKSVHSLKSLSVKWLEYDWSTNASEKIYFDSSLLYAQQSMLVSCLPMP